MGGVVDIESVDVFVVSEASVSSSRSFAGGRLDIPAFDCAILGASQKK